tara:strand:- start:121 stop:888 length:768 start_codon:yes stop_codon:yes gene_type:complete
MISRYNICTMFNLFRKAEPKIINLDEVFFDESNIGDFYKNYFNPRVPVLIKGGANSWPLMAKWNKEYVIKKAGNHMCTVVIDSRPASSRVQTTLKEYFKKHPGKSTLTLQRYQEGALIPILKDLPIPSPFFTNESIQRYFYYHSVKDAGTLPHMHGDAFNVLVSGSKHWVFHDASLLSAPKGNAKMNEFHKTYPIGSTAKKWFDKELPDFAASLKKTQIYQCIQEPGDIVYIPTEFSHTVLNMSEVMGVVVERSR